MAFFQALPWHPGEVEIQKLTRVPAADNPTQPMLPQHHARRMALSPNIALGTTDKDGRVWCTVWGGDAPIVQQVARGGIIGVRTLVDATFDPVAEALYGGQTDGEIVRQDPQNGKMVSALTIDLETRDRVKLFGRMVAGCLSTEEAAGNNATPADPDSASEKERIGKTGNAQLVLHITQSLGNCPKYINKKSVRSYTEAKPRLLSDAPLLTPEAVSHIHSADLIFVASRGPEDMDCNHRGGLPGFVRVQQPSTETASSPSEPQTSVIVWPEYSGNNLYQTLGNIVHDPHIGVVIPNFETGAVLYVSGTAKILLNTDASDVISKTKLAVRLTVEAARFVSDGLGFRGTPCTDNRDSSSSNPVANREITDGMSPYNPRVRYLKTELADPASIANSDPSANGGEPEVAATLIKKDKITPTITKYRFRLGPSSYSFKTPKSLSSLSDEHPLWQPGQYIAFDFSHDMDMGYSHMRDDDPTSINDDFIRTFTVSAPFIPPKSTSAEPEVEIMVRTVGTVTRWLGHQNVRAGLTHIGVLGFAGDFKFEKLLSPNAITTSDVETTAKKRKNAFIAAGIGITPLLGQLPRPAKEGSTTSEQEEVSNSLVLLWTLQIRDINLASHILAPPSPSSSQSYPASLKRNTHLFVTGTSSQSEDSEEMKILAQLEQDAAETGVKIHRRRLNKEDLALVEKGEQGYDQVEVANWYLCTAPAMRKDIQEWLGGRSVIFENFDY